jgi:hypothetical protein
MAITREMIRPLTWTELKQIEQIEGLTKRTKHLANLELAPTNNQVVELAEQVWTLIQKRYDPIDVLESPSMIAAEWLQNVYRPSSMRDIRGLPKSLRRQGLEALLDVYSDKEDVDLDTIAEELARNNALAETLLSDAAINTPKDVINTVENALSRGAIEQEGGCAVCHLPLDDGRWARTRRPDGSPYYVHIQCSPVGLLEQM